MILRKLASTVLPSGVHLDSEPITSTKAAAFKRFPISKYCFSENSLPVQGQLGNCWLIAPMLAIQLRSPSYFANRIYLAPDAGWARVKLELNGRNKWVKVSLNIPFTADGFPAYAYAISENVTSNGGKQRSLTYWASLFEKAVAQEIGNGYAGIARGFGNFGFSLFTSGKRVIRVPAPKLESLQQLLEQNYAVVASTHPLSKIFGNRIGVEVPANTHVMAVESVDLKNQTITIRNQWNPRQQLIYTEAEFRKLFLSIEGAKIS